MTLTKQTIEERIEGKQLRTTSSNPHAGEIVVRTSDLSTLFLDMCEEIVKEMYPRLNSLTSPVPSGASSIPEKKEIDNLCYQHQGREENMPFADVCIDCKFIRERKEEA